jgi:pre-mRNA-splicing factor 18
MQELSNLPRSEVIRKLRERGEPILLFGESEVDSFYRLRLLEISAPEINLGYRNDFQEAMDEVDQAYLQEMLTDNPVDPNKDKNKNEDIDVDESITWESLHEKAASLGRGNKEQDTKLCLNLLKFLLKTWHDQLHSVSTDEKMKTKTKIAKATFTQTRVYLKPLLKKLKNDKIPDDIFDSLIDIVKHLLKRDYIAASDSYLTMAIGNAPWPIGVTMVGIHARTGRERISSKNVAHVLNDETQRKYIQGLKRLMTKCQEFYPTDPSRSVEYVSKKDRAME